MMDVDANMSVEVRGPIAFVVYSRSCSVPLTLVASTMRCLTMNAIGDVSHVMSGCTRFTHIAKLCTGRPCAGCRCYGTTLTAPCVNRKKEAHSRGTENACCMPLLLYRGLPCGECSRTFLEKGIRMLSLARPLMHAFECIKSYQHCAAAMP